MATEHGIGVECRGYGQFTLDNYVLHSAVRPSVPQYRVFTFRGFYHLRDPLDDLDDGSVFAPRWLRRGTTDRRTLYTISPSSARGRQT